MTTSERADRNAAVVADRARGVAWAEIARAHDLTERQCRRIVQEYRDSRPALREVDPVAVVEDTLAAQESAISDLALLSERTDHDATRLGAIKARLSVYAERIELLQLVGMIPTDLGQLLIVEDNAEVVRQVVAVFSRNAVPDYVVEELLDVIGGAPVGENHRNAA
jgi:transposase-like protein